MHAEGQPHEMALPSAAVLGQCLPATSMTCRVAAVLYILIAHAYIKALWSVGLLSAPSCVVTGAGAAHAERSEGSWPPRC